MYLIKFKTFTYYTFLLLTIFIINTVYASGMMLAGEISVNHTAKDIIHEHDHHDMAKHNHKSHDSEQQQSTNQNCSKCGHCLACFTVLPPTQLAKIQSQTVTSTISLFEPSYLSHISAQPHRPPIS